MRKSHAFDECTETRVGAYAVEGGIDFEIHEPEAAAFEGFVEVLERLIVIAERGKNRCYSCGRSVSLGDRILQVFEYGGCFNFQACSSHGASERSHACETSRQLHGGLQRHNGIRVLTGEKICPAEIKVSAVELGI